MSTTSTRAPQTQARTTQQRPPAQRPGASLARAQSDAAVRGTFHLPEQVEDALRKAQERCHLVAPATTASALPAGCSVAISPVFVDVATETYGIPGSGDDGGGKRGLGKSVLDRIFAAVGGSWDPQQTRRIDDGSDPYFVHYQAVGHVRNFDGSVRVVKGEKIVDVREGSPAIQDLVSVSLAKLRKFAEHKNKSESELRRVARERAENQVRGIRLHILGHAESKAKNRAIRSLGIRTSYTVEELQKPFAAARPMFTGHSDDPELRRMFAQRIADTFLGTTTALYGAPAALPPGSPPPPVGMARRDALDDGFDEDAIDTHVVDDAPSRATSRAPQDERADETDDAGEPAGSSMILPFGRAKGTTIGTADDEDLEWVANALARMVEDPQKSRFRDDNQRLLDAIDRELARRRGEEEPPEDAPPSDDDYPT
ncbi:hypothetical protein [Sandaracinus amylolyticus]|nr:hypothetical protein [Sandaracinus amylolyticus]